MFKEHYLLQIFNARWFVYMAKSILFSIGDLASDNQKAPDRRSNRNHQRELGRIEATATRFGSYF